MFLEIKELFGSTLDKHMIMCNHIYDLCLMVLNFRLDEIIIQD